MNFIYRKLNAFSRGESTGNPAACLYLDKDQTLSEAEMLKVAQEHKGFVSEVIYCTPISEHYYKLRYYSSECEVEFCGHGTIACMYDLIRETDSLYNVKEIRINTNKGDLLVFNEIAKLDAVFITAPDPEFLTVPVTTQQTAAHLDIPSSKVDSNYPIMLIDAGLRTLIVPITGLQTLIGIYPNEAKLKDFCESNGIDIILIFSTEVSDEKNHMRTRVFAPKFGYLEDPATGSGNSALGYYMLSLKMWDGRPITIEQNAQVDHFNTVHIQTKESKVLFGGNAVIRISGEYIL